jgi:hypothetical protein
MKFPLLEQLRADRQRAEAEITAPLREVVDVLQSQVMSLRETVRSLERIMGNDIAKHVSAEVAHSLSAEIRRVIIDALVAAGNPMGKPITLTLSPDTIRFMDPDSLERQILDRYIGQHIPTLRLSATTNPKDCVTVLDVRIPELGSRHAIALH